jgi:hypothetical protein
MILQPCRLLIIPAPHLVGPFAWREALAAILIAGVFASSPTEVATNGCEVIPWNAQIELVERYPSGSRFLRVIKVKMTSPERWFRLSLQSAGRQSYRSGNLRVIARRKAAGLGA